MDIASLVGILGAIGLIVVAMTAGGSINTFIDVPSVQIVFGGTAFGVMYSATLPAFLGSFGVMAKAFFHLLKNKMN